MPKLKPETHAARRTHVLDCAERCFSRLGFHRTTMADICSEAGISAGALYVYFNSKEALIAGIIERDRAQLTERFNLLFDSPDVIGALAALGQTYFVEEPPHKRQLAAEIGLEANRNEAVGQAFHDVDTYCRESFQALFATQAAEGRIAPTLDPQTLTMVVTIIGDGLIWRRAIDPNFDANSVLPALLDIIGRLLNPQGQLAADTVATHKPSEKTR